MPREHEGRVPQGIGASSDEEVVESADEQRQRLRGKGLDEQQELLAPGEDMLPRRMSLLGGRIAISKIEGAWGGSAVGRFKIPELGAKGVASFKAEREGGEAILEGRAKVKLSVFRDAATGRRLKGEAGVVFRGGKNPSVRIEGEADYRLDRRLGGRLKLSADEALDPVLSGSLDMDGATLHEGGSVLDEELDVLPSTKVPVLGALGLDVGVAAGASLSTRPVTMSARAAVSGWRPVSQGLQVPDFEAAAQLMTGLDLRAFVAPFLGLVGDAGIAKLGAGLEGMAEVRAGAAIKPKGRIAGRGGRFEGRYDLGVALTPLFRLALKPYLSGALLAQGFRHDFAGLSMDLGKAFTLDIGQRITFGDAGTQRARIAAGQRLELPASVRAHALSKGAAHALSTGGRAPTPSALGLGADGVGFAPGRARGPLGGLLRQAQEIAELAGGVGSLSNLISIFSSLVLGATTMGPLAIPIWLAWMWWCGQLDWDARKADFERALGLLGSGAHFLADQLPTWWPGVASYFTDPPSLMGALWGSNEEMIQSVARGEHELAPAGMRAHMLTVIRDGVYSWEAMEAAQRVLEFSATKGDLREVVGGYTSSAYYLVYSRTRWGTTYTDEKVRALFDSQGIDYSG